MKRRVLVISTVGLIYDGITSVILANLQAMKCENVKLYVVSTIKAEDTICQEFINLGCELVELPNRKENPLKYFFALWRFIKKNKIEVIHANGNSATLAVEMVAAMLGGCKKRIAHSHNTRCDQKKADKILRPLFYATYTDALACGDEAGRWLFPNRDFVVINNGRDINKFSYNQDVREQMREKLNIGKNIAIGHVGGFVPQKNHEFLLEIYKHILIKMPNAKLYMFGDGYLMDEIKGKAKLLGIEKNIIFTGNVSNVADYINAMDAMILPSLFEGLPLVVIEWQINGIPTLISDRITNECILTDFVKVMSLEQNPEEWSEEILNMAQNSHRIGASEIMIQKIKQAGFDIIDSSKKLEQIYCSK